MDEATWESGSAFLLPNGRFNSVVVEYLSQNNLGELLRLAKLLAQKAQGLALFESFARETHSLLLSMSLTYGGLWQALGSVCRGTPLAFRILCNVLCEGKVACICLQLG